MTKTRKNNNEKKAIPNPDGYDITIYPEYWTGVLSFAITFVVMFRVCLSFNSIIC